MSAMVRGIVVVVATALLVLAARPANADENPTQTQKAAIFAKSSVVRGAMWLSAGSARFAANGMGAAAALPTLSS